MIMSTHLFGGFQRVLQKSVPRCKETLHPNASRSYQWTSQSTSQAWRSWGCEFRSGTSPWELTSSLAISKICKESTRRSRVPMHSLRQRSLTWESSSQSFNKPSSKRRPSRHKIKGSSRAKKSWRKSWTVRCSSSLSRSVWSKNSLCWSRSSWRIKNYH